MLRTQVASTVVANSADAAPPTDPRQLLGQRTPADFLARHWQREPLLIRGAWVGAAMLFTADELFALAARDDVESRVVVRARGEWTLEHGPFSRRALKRLPPRGWTLLVQGVNLHNRRADALLRAFSFLPFARLDDLMVSYAAPGGGVGPHVDSYDVFLLQGFGRRRWRHGLQADCRLRDNLPLKILRSFRPTHDEILAPGDMLYLPPQHAHDGVALEACTTYSIGFRAPSAQELGIAFLSYLQDRLQLTGRYADRGLTPTPEPARIEAAMQAQCAHMLDAIAWTRGDIDRFLGSWLSEPKPDVFFERPEPALAKAAFVRRARRAGVALDMRTQLLYDDAHLFVNGAALPWGAQRSPALVTLATARRLSAEACDAANAEEIALIHTWYRDGFLHFDT